MKKLILLILIFSFQAKAEIVTATGTHKHTGNFSPNESCSIALEKAKLDAMRKVLGESISSEVFSSCSEVDGELNCERNQFSLLKLRGDIVDLKTDEPVHDNNEDAGFVGTGGFASINYDFSVKEMVRIIKSDLKEMGINHDKWFYESSVGKFDDANSLLFQSVNEIKGN